MHGLAVHERRESLPSPNGLPDPLWVSGNICDLKRDMNPREEILDSPGWCANCPSGQQELDLRLCQDDGWIGSECRVGVHESEFPSLRMPVKGGGNLGQFASPPGDALRPYLTTPVLRLRLVNLPSYSPDFNADEAIWGWVRQEVTAN